MKTLSFGQRTKQLIANMAKINQSMLFIKGQKQYTWSAVKGGGDAAVWVTATLKEEVPCEFGINDLSKMLNILSLYDKPTISVNDKLMIIVGEDGRSYQHIITPKEQIYSPDGHLELEDRAILANFELKGSALQNLNRILGVADLDQVRFKGTGKDLAIIADKSGGNSSDIYAEMMGKCDKKFNVIFKPFKLQALMDNTYQVKVAERFVEFKGPDIEYIIAPESNSTYK